MKVKLFTHTDLDGVFCAMLYKVWLGSDIDAVYCDYTNINEKITEFIESKEYTAYSQICITDISVDATTAKLLDDIRGATEIVLLDHHPTAMWLNETYNWATVIIDVEPGKQACGAYMLHEYLKTHESFESCFGDTMDGIVETVRRYDTWEWFTIYNDGFPNNLNTLLYLLGRDRFIKRFFGKLSKNRTTIFDRTDKLLLEMEREKIDSYIRSIHYNLPRIKLDINGRIYRAGVAFMDKYISEGGNALCQLNEDIDFIIMINLKSSFSFRTIKDNVNLSEIAQAFGGGGHTKAAGANLSRKLAHKMAEDIVKKTLSHNEEDN